MIYLTHRIIIDEGDVKVDVCDNGESDDGVCSSDMVNEICDMRHSESLKDMHWTSYGCTMCHDIFTHR